MVARSLKAYRIRLQPAPSCSLIWSAPTLGTDSFTEKGDVARCPPEAMERGGAQHFLAAH